ncbi:MAG: Trk family potassium uptake protein [Chloroflexi bacterium]|nr:Trk family potassium uptake protein [Chloroflexota bacterium]
MSIRERPVASGVHVTRMVARRKFRGPGSGISEILGGFGIVLATGSLLLMLPIASESGDWGSLVDAVFTAVSAICVTGLVLHDTQAHWSAFGEGVILLLIQVGGLGYMLGTTVVLWAFGRQLGLRDRNMLRLYYGAPSMKETLSFARGVALFTLMFEAAGAAILTAAFLVDGHDPGEALWWGIFHAVSAFNNAGFSVTGADMAPFSGNPVVLLTLTTLIVAGGIGFIPLLMLKNRRSFRRLPLDSKLILSTSAALLVAGTLFVGVFEWRNDGTLGAVPAEDRPVVALFHSANARTAGFSAIDVGALHDESKVLTVGLMFVGGAAGSTAGGLKVGAFAMLFAVMLATLRGREEVSVFRRQVPTAIVQQATTLALYFVALVFSFSLALTLTSHQEFLDTLFETMSALGTVGFSAAGTPVFGTGGHVVLIVAMLFGRFSPLMLVLYMSQPRKKPTYHSPTDSVRLG